MTVSGSGPSGASAAPDLTGQVVIVTGGARGIGRGIADGFLAAGADVTICGRSEPEAVPAVDGRAATFVAADVREPDDVERVVATPSSRSGRARRAREQRRRLAPGRLGHRVAALLPGHHRAEPHRTARLLPAGQRGDAGPGDRRFDRQHRQRERDSSQPGQRGLRRGQGGTAEPHQRRSRSTSRPGSGSTR